ncbi:MAG TPA: M20/M25/M40 family metallo-hydrolase [Acidobacteriaceae bacterium]
MSAFHRIQQLATQPRVHAAFQWLHLHERQLRRWQMDMATIPAPPFGESQRAAWLLERFREIGLSEPHIDTEGNVLAQLAPPPSEQPAILLSAHIDTVFPAGTDCTPREVESRIYAPGICDNAAGVVALLGIAAALRATGFEGFNRTLLFAGNVGEEGEGDLRGMRHIFRSSLPIVAALALDGSGTNTVVTHALGSRRFRITINGPGGHSWSDAGTPNPAVILSRALVTLSDLPLPETPRTTLNIGTMSSGTAINSIPQRAIAHVDMRSQDPAELLRLEVFLHRAVEDAVLAANQSASESSSRQQPPRITYTIDLIGDRPSAALPEGAPLLDTIRAVDRHLSIQTAPRLGSTDANIPLALSIPAVALGAGGTCGGVHTTGEWYSPEGRELALRRILLTVLDLCRE